MSSWEDGEAFHDLLFGIPRMSHALLTYLDTFQERYSRRRSILGIKEAWYFGSNEMADPTKGNSKLFLMTLHPLVIL